MLAAILTPNFGVHSSSHFLFTAWTDRPPHTRSQMHISATTGVGNDATQNIQWTTWYEPWRHQAKLADEHSLHATHESTSRLDPIPPTQCSQFSFTHSNIYSTLFCTESAKCANCTLHQQCAGSGSFYFITTTYNRKMANGDLRFHLYLHILLSVLGTQNDAVALFSLTTVLDSNPKLCSTYKQCRCVLLPTKMSDIF